jgi:endoglucanase
MKRPALVSFLQRLLSLPTAPFHERFVSAFLFEELEKSGFDACHDRFGNIVVEHGKGKRPFAWVAHMDHPGFEIADATAGKTTADWFGGVDAKYFVGSRVVTYERSSGAIGSRGIVRRVAKNSHGRVEKMELRVRGRALPGDFGGWDLVPFRRRGDFIDTKGADDLVGCAVMVCALKELKRRRINRKVIAIFTRAEEIGFIGTLGTIKERVLPAGTKMLSIETSKALPGIAFGGGPVIRLGDRASMFDHGMIRFMDRVARQIQKRDRRFAWQRRVMDGGTCEATPYQLEGYVTGGVAVPLRNYHNQGRKRIGPEGVHLRDVQGAVRLLVEMTARMNEFDVATEEVRKRIEAGWRKYGGRLVK